MIATAVITTVDIATGLALVVALVGLGLWFRTWCGPISDTREDDSEDDDGEPNEVPVW